MNSPHYWADLNFLSLPIASWRGGEGEGGGEVVSHGDQTDRQVGLRDQGGTETGQER